MAEPYSPKLLAYFRSAAHAAAMDVNDAAVVVGEAGAPEGERVRFYIRSSAEKIMQVSFRAYGSAALIGCAEFIAKSLEGSEWSQAETWTREKLLNALELAPVKIHITELIISALQQCIQKFKVKSMMHAGKYDS